MDIRFFNTHNLVHPLLDHILVRLNNRKVKSAGYISSWKYRSSIDGADKINYFEKATLTKLSAFNKRANQFMYALAATLKILFTRPQLNVFYTQPPLFVIWGAWLSRVCGVPYIIHVQDLYPDIIGKLNILNEDKWLYNYLDNKMIKAINKAESVIVLGICMVNKLLSKGIAPEHIKTVINIPAATEKIEPVAYLSKLGIEGKYTVLYAGNMGMAHEFETILSVAAKLSESHPNIHFLFVANGRRRGMAEKYLQRGFKNMTLIDYPPHEIFMSILQETDVHYITLKKSFEGVMVPCKFYSSLAIGKPIIYEGTTTSELGVEIIEHKLGESIEHLDEAKLEAAILKYYDNKSLLDSTGKRVEEYFSHECDLTTVVDSYEQILKHHLTQSNRA